jgi:hypothetical protein
MKSVLADRKQLLTDAAPHKWGNLGQKAGCHRGGETLPEEDQQ